MELTKINDVSKYFKREENKWIFQGDSLEIYIPRIYEEKGLLVIGEIATSLGIFQIRIDDKYFTNFLFLGKLNIEFISQRNVTEDDYKYIVLSLTNGSTFIDNAVVVKNGDLLYLIFNMFLSYGKIPPFLSYTDIHTLFDHDNEHCGISLKINHTIFEMIYAHIFRDQNDPYTFYRHTPMTMKPQIVPLRQISHGPTSTTARISGGYLSEGITSALVDESQKNPSTIENLLRS